MPRKRDFNAAQFADSHAGIHGGCRIAWLDTAISKDGNICKEGWYIAFPKRQGGDIFGPYKTSQAAFCDLKQAIDNLIERLP